MSEKRKKIRPSLLDRLRDQSGESVSGFSDYELRESVQTDLQNLLNTRIRFLSPAEELQNTHDTVFNYGLPDLTSQQLTSEEGQKAFAEWIERTIRRYEPRLKSIHVTPIASGDSSGRFTFRVDAILYADPVPEDVSFDSVIDPLTQNISLQESLQ